MRVQEGRAERTGAARRPEAVIRLLACPDAPTLLTTAMEVGLAEIGAHSGAVYVVQDDGWLRLATASGVDERLVERFRLVSPDADLPVAIAARLRHPVYRLAQSYRESYPGMAEFRVPAGFAALPLMVDEECLGVLAVQLERPEPLSEDEHLTLSMLSTVCAHRLEHLLSTGGGSSPPGAPQLDQAVRLVEGRSRAARLELAMSSADIGSFDWDFATGRVAWDERLCRLFGVEPDAFDERIETFFGAVHPEDRPAVDRAVKESRTTGSYAAVYRVVRPDGSVRWMDAKGSVFRDSRGEPRGMVGVAQDRTGEFEREARRDERREFVLETTAAFAAALTTQDVVDTMTGKVLPAMGAKALVVHLEQNGRLLVAGARGYPKEAMCRLRDVGFVTGRAPLRVALDSGRPLFIESREEYLTSYPDPRVRPAEEHHAWVVMPLLTAGGTIGTCTISYAEPRRFTADDEVLCTAVAGILAQSLARARLFDQGRGQMTELQRVMLPRHVPRLPGVEIAVRYLPGSDGMEVGGDWYDVLPLAEGRIGLVIGDVQGHSAQAAAVMGQLRTAILAYADDGHATGTLMRRGNRMLCELDTDLFATCCMVELDPRAGVIRMARAGHPYPLLMEADGTVHELEGRGGLPLGMDKDQDYPVVERELPPGATLLLYTDGLVENKQQGYEEAVAGLARSLARRLGRGDGERGLEELADRIAAPAVGRAAHDDIAVLLVRCPD